MKIRRSWILILVVIALMAGGGYYVMRQTAWTLPGQETAESVVTTAAGDVNSQQTVQIQQAAAVIDEVQAAGAIALTSEEYVALAVDGVVDQVEVKVGDVVTAGQVLLTLDTVELERSLRRAELAVQTQLNNLEQLKQAATANDLTAAEAELAAAEANLNDIKAGPSTREIAAARSSAASAWAKYNELQAGPSEAELTQLSADLKRKEVALAEAQRAYDKVAWRNDIGMTQEAATLQTATINYEESKAAYTESTASVTGSELQSALSAAQDAQQKLDDLLAQPSAADIATAESQVASARSKLAELQQGADALELQSAQISLESALLDLEEAHADLANATVTAPMAGAVLTVDAKIGQRVSRGAVVATLADLAHLELTIDVADVDIGQVSVGQAATVGIDAMPGQTFAGIVATIAPASDSESGVVNYPVTIRLTETTLTGVRPGMKAVATLPNTTASLTANSWLVPTAALHTTGDSATVIVARNGVTTTVAVVPGAIQGEWTVVNGPGLQHGDEVTAQLTSSIGENDGFGPPGGGPSGGGPPPGGN